MPDNGIDFDAEHDQMVAAYEQQRDQIAKENDLTLLTDLDATGWSTSNEYITTSPRDDYEGHELLKEFGRIASQYKGGCYADDGEGIALWKDHPKE